MSKWSVLGISPTDDVGAIKKAYAAKLKLCHPEDDPEGYQSLREAYDYAIKYAKGNTRRFASNFEYENQDVSDNDMQPPKVKLRNEFVSDSISLESENEEFIKDAERIYNDFSFRIDKEKWDNLLNCDLIWNINNQELDKKMITFLLTHHYLPNNIWRLLDTHFDWSKSLKYRDNYFRSEFIDYIKRRTSERRFLDYSHLAGINIIELEGYLEHRESAFDDINNYDFNSAYISIMQAEEIYNGDPELWKLKGIHCFYMGKLEAAEELFNRCMEFKKDDIVSLYLARILYRRGKFNEAVAECQNIQDVKAMGSEQLESIARCYIKVERFEEAEKILQNAIELDPKSKDLSNLLIELNKKISGDIEKDVSSKRHFFKSRRNKILVVVITIFAIALISFSIARNNLIDNDFSDRQSISNEDKPTPVLEDEKYINIFNIEMLSSYGNESRIDLKNIIYPSLKCAVAYEEDGVSRLNFSDYDINEYKNVVDGDLVVEIGEYNGKKIILLSKPFDFLSRRIPKSVKIRGFVYDSKIDITESMKHKFVKLGISANEIISDKYVVLESISYDYETYKSSYERPASGPDLSLVFRAIAMLIVFIIIGARNSRN